MVSVGLRRRRTLTCVLGRGPCGEAPLRRTPLAGKLRLRGVPGEGMPQLGVGGPVVGCALGGGECPR